MRDPIQAHGFEVVGQRAGSAIRRAPGYSGKMALEVLARGVSERAFPGAAFAASHRGELVLQGAVGRFRYEEASEEVTLSTVFDLASVTKAIATTSMAMLLYERGKLRLSGSVVELVPEFAGPDRRRQQISVQMLLAHSSGLPAYERLFERTKDRARLIELACRVPLVADPEARAEYSDIGFIILGELLERISREPLDVFCAREVFIPLKMRSTGFGPQPRLRQSIPPTVDDRSFRHRVIQGEVHDENASVMDGVSGHAGAFGNTTDLMAFSACMLGYGPQVFQKETIDLFTRRQSAPEGTSRALGWDTPSLPSQSGEHFSPYSWGHLGYTGTSLWIDGKRKIAVALLTNRTWPNQDSRLIQQFRPAFHDAVMKELLSVAPS